MIKGVYGGLLNPFFCFILTTRFIAKYKLLFISKNINITSSNTPITIRIINFPPSWVRKVSNANSTPTPNKPNSTTKSPILKPKSSAKSAASRKSRTPLIYVITCTKSTIKISLIRPLITIIGTGRSI
jgi:hypothetical protein